MSLYFLFLSFSSMISHAFISSFSGRLDWHFKYIYSSLKANNSSSSAKALMYDEICMTAT